MNDSITVISSKRKIFNLNLKELWKYRDLIFLFVKRDFVSKYKQTVLGPLWAIIQPLFTTLVFTVIFGNLARLTTMDSINQEGSKFFILHVWKYMLGVFFRMFKFLWKYIYWKRWYTGKGIFSTIGYANISYFFTVN